MFSILNACSRLKMLQHWGNEGEFYTGSFVLHNFIDSTPHSIDIIYVSIQDVAK